MTTFVTIYVYSKKLKLGRKYHFHMVYMLNQILTIFFVVFSLLGGVQNFESLNFR